MKGRTEVPTAPKNGGRHLTELALKVPTHQKADIPPKRLNLPRKKPHLLREGGNLAAVLLNLGLRPIYSFRQCGNLGLDPAERRPDLPDEGFDGRRHPPDGLQGLTLNVQDRSGIRGIFFPGPLPASSTHDS